MLSRPTIGLALSGGGNRSSFYIGFLEVFGEYNVPIDYITATSGGSLVAAAYSCGVLEQFKQKIFTINKDTIKQYIVKSKGGGGLYSLHYLEEELRTMFSGLNFEDVKPTMSFVAADIETGQQVVLCMGDIAHAACISCVLPGIFEPVQWGSRTLVDGGLISQIPLDVLETYHPDIAVGVSLRGTKHIFKNEQLQLKKMLNAFWKFLFLDEITSWFSQIFEHDDDSHDFSRKPSLFSILGKSMDIAIQASRHEPIMPKPDVLIKLDMSKINRTEFNEATIRYYYTLGRETAEQYMPSIQESIRQKSKVEAKS